MPEAPRSELLSGLHVDCSALPSGSAPCPNYWGLLLNPSFHLGLHSTIICAPESGSLADSHPGPPRTHLQVLRVHVKRQDGMEPSVQPIRSRTLQLLRLLALTPALVCLCAFRLRRTRSAVWAMFTPPSETTPTLWQAINSVSC